MLLDLKVSSPALRRGVLVALGDGGTTEMADGVMAYLSGLPSVRLGGTAEVARELKLSPQAISTRRVRTGRPTPLVTLHCGPVFDLNSVVLSAQTTDIGHG